MTIVTRYNYVVPLENFQGIISGFISPSVEDYRSFLGFLSDLKDKKIYYI